MLQSAPQNLKWLKLAVITMGIVIFLGTCVVVATILHRLNAAPPALAHFDIALPPGAQVLESSGDGGRLLLRIKIGDREELRIIELSTGREVARMGLGPAP